MKTKYSAGTAIVYKGKILLAHTTGRKWSGGYGIPKGGIDEGESKVEAAIRETYEEVGIKLDKDFVFDKEYTYNPLASTMIVNNDCAAPQYKCTNRLYNGTCCKTFDGTFGCCPHEG